MARYSGAQWRPISINYNLGGIAPRILIVHIMQGTLAGTDSWFRNPDAQVSAHFGVGKTGTIYQWVDTANRAWHASAWTLRSTAFGRSVMLHWVSRFLEQAAIVPALTQRRPRWMARLASRSASRALMSSRRSYSFLPLARPSRIFARPFFQ